MNDARLESCLDYLKFTIESEGEEFSKEHNGVLRDILEEEVSADSAVEQYLASLSLERKSIADENPMSRYAGTRCIVNYFGIKDKKALKLLDKEISNMRTAELFVNPHSMDFDFNYLKALHKHIFGDIYPSAGCIRTSNTSKKTEFCPASDILRSSDELFSKLSDDNYLVDIYDTDDFVNELAYFMGEMELLHPFMDGNGRVTRLFFNRLAMNAGYDIIWASADPDHYLEANIAAIDGDYQALIDVLEEIVIPRSR